MKSRLLLLTLLCGVLLLLLASCQLEQADDPAMPSASERWASQFYAYAGRDSLIQSTLAELRHHANIQEWIKSYQQDRARPLWDVAVHVGEVNEEEALYIPIVVKGRQQIEWIWVLYASHGSDLRGYYVSRASIRQEYLWMFDYFTQRVFHPQGRGEMAARSTYYKQIGNTLCACVRVPRISLPGLGNESSGKYTPFPMAPDFSINNCFPIPRWSIPGSEDVIADPVLDTARRRRIEGMPPPPRFAPSGPVEGPPPTPPPPPPPSSL